MTKISLILTGTALLFSSFAFSETRPGWGFAPLNPDFIAYTNRQAAQAHSLSTEGEHATGYIPSPVDMSHLRHLSKRLRFQSSVSDLPAQYDLRSVPEKLSPVRDQNPFGTCWTFAFCASAESCLRPGIISDFSEWHMAHSSGFDTGWNGGGNFYMALAYCATWKGLVNESACPYNYQYNATATNFDFSSVPVSWRIREAHFLPSDAVDVKHSIMEHGPVVAIIAPWNNNSTNSYDYNGHSTVTYCASGIVSGENHLVSIVGWDDAIPASAFINRPSTNGAWIVRNSWGTNWGDGGYFYLSYFDPTLRMQGCITDIHAAEDDPDLLCSYTPFGFCDWFGVGTNSAWGANIFTPAVMQNLSSVGFYLPAHGSSYEVRIYTGGSASNPVSGTCLYGPQGTIGPSLASTKIYAGYYTVELPSAIQIPAGQRFSVVVHFSTPDFIFPLGLEFSISGYSSKATASPGQSFCSPDCIQWIDLTSIKPTANLCIDAFSNYITLQPPNNISATDDVYTDRVRLSWIETVKADRYAIYRLNGTGSFSNAVRLTTIMDSPYDDTNAVAGVTYSYWVTACKGEEEGGPCLPDTGRRESVTFNSLVSALDSSGLTWTTGGNGIWYGQTVTYYFGGRSARSGTVGNSQMTWMQTTVTGPGVLSFYWKVSSELGSWTAIYDYDYLRFYYDGVELTKIAGEKNWAWKGYSIPAGTHSLIWAYTKDASTSSGSDCGWVDKVVWEPEIKLADLALSKVYVGSSSWRAGDAITVSVTEENQGTGLAQAHRTQLYLSADATITSADTPLGDPISYRKLGASNMVSRQVSFLAPDKMQGPYYLGAHLDIDGRVSETSTANNSGILSQAITYANVVALPNDCGALSQTDTTLYSDWIIGHSGWATDYAAVPMTDFTSAYLLDERPSNGVTERTSFTITCFTVSDIDIVVGLALSVSFIPKHGPINGCMVIDGRESLASNWRTVAYRPLSDGKLSFTDGQVSLTFIRPEGYPFFRARIQKDTPVSGTMLHLMHD